MNFENFINIVLVFLSSLTFAGLIYLLILACKRRSQGKFNKIDKRFGRLYFSRAELFDILEKHIVVIESKKPCLTTLDPWYEIIFSAADGQMTITEFTQKLKKEYSSGPPPELEAVVQQHVRALKDIGFITLTDKPKILPYYLQMPSSQQDQEKAKRLMEEDGFIKKTKASQNF